MLVAVKNYKTSNLIRKRNEIIVIITYDSKYISMAATIQITWEK
jgi:general stress protein 26